MAYMGWHGTDLLPKGNTDSKFMALYSLTSAQAAAYHYTQTHIVIYHPADIEMTEKNITNNKTTKDIHYVGLKFVFS